MTECKTAWSHEGKDGKAELLINLNDDPDDTSATVIRVSGRNQSDVAKLLADLLNRNEFGKPADVKLTGHAR
jgi:hypothetical protein